MNRVEFKQSLQRAGLTPEDAEQYLQLLMENGFENEHLRRALTMEDLAIMGVKRIGHAKAILSAVKKIQRIKVPKRHAFYISHDKMDAGAELVWAVQTDTPICIVRVERLGLGSVHESLILSGNVLSFLSPSDWAKLESMNIVSDQVHSAMSILFQGSRSSLVFQPHEMRETRAGFLLQLWRYMGAIAASEAGNQVYALDEAVEVRWRKGGKWYPGHVSEIAPNGTYSISYDDGDTENEVTAEFMRQRVRAPVVVYEQDERVEVKWKRRESYFPGRVVAVYEHLNAYDIVYDDGDIEFRVRYEMMKKLNRFQ